MIGHPGAVAQIYLALAAGLLALAYSSMQRARTAELARRRDLTDEALSLERRVETLELALEQERRKPREFHAPERGPAAEVKVEEPEPPGDTAT